LRRWASAIGVTVAVRWRWTLTFSAKLHDDRALGTGPSARPTREGKGGGMARMVGTDDTGACGSCSTWLWSWL